MPEAYTFNKKTGVHRLQFGLNWPDNHDWATGYYSFSDGWGKFAINGSNNGCTIGYSVKLDEVNEAKYGVFKSCSVSVKGGKWLAYNAIEILPNVVDNQFLATILKSQLPGKNTKFILEFILTSNTVTVPPSEPVAPAPTLGDVILEKLYNDDVHEDVFFTFDPPSDVITTAEETDVASDKVSGSNMDARESTKHTGEVPSESGVDLSKSDNVSNSPNPYVACARRSTASTIGAHKLVLCQWPYFKAMLDGGFAEGGTGNKTIRIKDASPKAFHMLLRFMYTGKLPDDAQPTSVYIDPLNKYTDASWESLYLLAHRYDIQELVDITRENILSNLDPKESVPFLFRTAYLFADLREPVIKYAAESCRSTFASKSARAKYLDHPEIVELFGELLEQMCAIEE
ncbi:hypothetical protein MVEG_00139 [Podila verticillata NRRL 6337]|nr:hypothetical protein MVEG_00139 [Podila verticillata NRRL 6337]